MSTYLMIKSDLHLAPHLKINTNSIQRPEHETLNTEVPRRNHK